MFVYLLLSTVFVLIAFIYFHVKTTYSYWARRGVPYLKPSFPFGNFGKGFLQNSSIADQLNELYRSTTEPFIGTYMFLQPTLIARCPEFIRNILITDFQYFTDRRLYVNEKREPLSAHFGALNGDRWRNLRAKFTPAFTSAKMRAIFSTLVDANSPLLNHIENISKHNETVEARGMTSCYVANIIASVMFGIEIDCFAEPNNPFRKYGQQWFEPSVKNRIRFIGFIICPTLLKWSRIRLVDQEVDDFFLDVIKQSLEMREKENFVRKDFFQLLVQLRNLSSESTDDQFKTIIMNEHEEMLTVEQITAQAFIFYMASFEASLSTMALCLYEIAKDPEIQRKAQKEIDNVMAKCNGQLTYESINEMKYLECCIDETLRKYCIVPSFHRVCVKDYKIPGTNVTLEKGTPILIPSCAIQRDEKFYPDPEKFDPLRFSSENMNGKTFLDMPYLPFGDGPRNCIGMRMGQLMVKVGIASILKKYNVELDEQHIGKELSFSEKHLLVIPKHEINLKFGSRT